MIFVKPAEGIRFVMPPALGQTRGAPLPKIGDRVHHTPFIARAIARGDLVEITEQDLADARGKLAAEQQAAARAEADLQASEAKGAETKAAVAKPQETPPKPAAAATKES